MKKLPRKRERNTYTQYITSFQGLCQAFYLPLPLLPGIGKFQTNDIEDFLPLPTVIVFHKITELHLAVGLAGHINHINLFVRTWNNEMGSAPNGLGPRKPPSPPHLSLEWTDTQNFSPQTLYPCVHVWEVGAGIPHILLRSMSWVQACQSNRIAWHTASLTVQSTCWGPISSLLFLSPKTHAQETTGTWGQKSKAFSSQQKRDHHDPWNSPGKRKMGLNLEVCGPPRGKGKEKQDFGSSFAKEWLWVNHFTSDSQDG